MAIKGLATKLAVSARSISSGLESATNRAAQQADAAADLIGKADKCRIPRFVFPSSATSSGGIDLAPDLISQARTHSDEVELQALQDGVRPAKLATAFYNRKTGKIFFGSNNTFYPGAGTYAKEAEGIRLGPPFPLHWELESRMPKRSLEDWPAGGCAEIHAANRALLVAQRTGENPALEDYAYATVHNGQHRGPCRNCQAMLGGALEVTEAGSQRGLFLGGAVR